MLYKATIDRNYESRAIPVHRLDNVEEFITFSSKEKSKIFNIFPPIFYVV
jgi:hypothetical protein